MKIYKEIDPSDHEAWSGAKETLQTIIDNDKEQAFNQLMEELHPDGMSETELNDILWFESEWLYDQLGINEEEEEEEED